MNVDIVVPNQTRYLRLVGNIAEQVAKEVEATKHDRETLAYNLNLVLTEAVANAIEYSQPNNLGETVKVCLSVENSDLWIRVFDQGKGFDLNAVPTPDFDNLTERGRGIFFIRSLMDYVEYRRTDRGNVLEMCKHLQ
ncbi:ATP-binding protein [Methylocystis sp. JAN1]|uniref:ATP-binding protein n=1 Tax=Methylocystis sp. JAN1 TaxID=3397211 RepID=UPI003FA258A8